MANIFELFGSIGTIEPNTLLVQFLLPFMLIFAIFWGTLSMLKIFGPPTDKTTKKINIIVSLIIAILVAVTDVWGLLITQISALTGAFAFGLFIVLFIVGGIIWAIGRGKAVFNSQELYQLSNSKSTLKKLDKHMEDRYKKLQEARNKGNYAAASEYEDEILKMRKEREKLLGLKGV